MAKYPVPENPVYNNQITKIENTAAVQADTVLNPVIEQLIENTEAVKKSIAIFTGTTGGSSTGYTLTVGDDFELVDGVRLHIKLHTTCGASPALNVNNSGWKAILYPNGRNLYAGDITENMYVDLIYNGAQYYTTEPSTKLTAGDGITVEQASNTIAVKPEPDSGLGVSSAGVGFAAGYVAMTEEEREKLAGIEADIGRKPATVVIGAADAGYLEKDVDILIPAGSTNCISQLNAALAAVPPTGGKILLLNGTYAFASPWVIEQDNITIEGCGAGNTILNMTGARSSSDSEAAAKSSNSVIYIKGNRNVVSELTVTTPDTNGLSVGVYLGDSSGNNRITGVRCSNFSNGYGSVGIYLNNSKNNSITGNVIDNGSNTVNPSCHGIRLSFSSGNNIAENIINTAINSSSSGAKCYGVFLDEAFDNTITENSLHLSGYSYNTYGVYLNNSGDNTIEQNMHNRNGNGIQLKGSSRNSIIGNTINSDLCSTGIHISDSSSDNIIMGNNVRNNMTGNGPYYGIHLSSAPNSIITENVCVPSCDSTGSFTGIYTMQSPDSTIAGNICAPVSSAGGSTGISVRFSPYCTVAGNKVGGSGNNSSGIVIYSSSCCAITGNVCSNVNVFSGAIPTSGIALELSNGCTVMGNTCCNSGDGSTPGMGIRIADSSDNNISDNVLANTHSTGKCYGVCMEAISSRKSDGNIIAGNIFKNSVVTGQSTTNAYAIRIANASSYTMITNNNITGVTKAASPGSAYTKTGSAPVEIKGSPITIEAFETDGACGFNIA